MRFVPLDKFRIMLKACSATSPPKTFGVLKTEILFFFAAFKSILSTPIPHLIITLSPSDLDLTITSSLISSSPAIIKLKPGINLAFHKNENC